MGRHVSDGALAIYPEGTATQTFLFSWNFFDLLPFFRDYAHQEWCFVLLIL